MHDWQIASVEKEKPQIGFFIVSDIRLLLGTSNHFFINLFRKIGMRYFFNQWDDILGLSFFLFLDL